MLCVSLGSKTALALQEVARQRTGRAVRGRPGARRSVFVRHPAAARAPAAQLPPSHAPRDKGSVQTQSSNLKLPNAWPLVKLSYLNKSKFYVGNF